MATGEQQEPNQKVMSKWDEQDARKSEKRGDEVAVTVREGKMLTNFLKPLFGKDDDDNRTLILRMSMVLTPAHKGILPPIVEKYWRVVQGGNVPSMKIDGIEMQTIELSIDPTHKKPSFRCAEVAIENAALAVVEEKGKGEAKVVERFTFDAVLSLEPELGMWAQSNYDAQFWMLMQPLQRKLIH